MNPIRKVVREIVSKELNEADVSFNRATGYYSINGNIIEKLDFLDSTTNKIDFLNDNKDSVEFSWLFQSSFFAQEIVINERTMKVIKFVGEWYDGIFKGSSFTSNISTGQLDVNRLGFNGGYFKGNVFKLNYSFWRTSPVNFISGTIDNSGNGILGLPDLENGIIKSKNHLIQVPVGKYILFKIQGDEAVYPIKVLKRLDDRSSDFQYLDLVTNKSAIIPWETIRMNFKNLLIGRSKNGIILPGLVSLSGVIEGVEISDSINDTFKKKKNDLVNITSYKIPLSNLSNIFDVDINIPTEELKKDINLDNSLKLKMQRIYSDFNNNDGKEFLRSIKKIINQTVLTGEKISKKDLSSIGLNYLSPVLGGLINEKLDQGLVSELSYLNDFAYIIQNYAENPSEIFSQIRKYISSQMTGDEPETKEEPTKTGTKLKNF